ncbi:MAG: efflux RND transporter periplasmic adaptor subunit [Oscillatoria sp. PMC 1068.18]|nr:efflux RND transporter periplasmic adaptor subunit [Oscillatoria sp. PMC 1076.18]MEC4989625.1 efflux RND transporter periplasmic adaptor subunit [Oscillatoria sp. PMC 1068.18]
MDKKLLKFRFPTRTIVLLLILGLLTGGTIFFIQRLREREIAETELSEATINAVEIEQITALGRLEPQGEIIYLAAPSATKRLSQLLVQEGDAVDAGEVIAIMDGLELRQADLKSAEAKVKVVEARLAQVKAGQAPGDIEAQSRRVAELQAQLTGDVTVQKTAIARHRVELEKAEVDYQRYQQLAADGIVAQSEVDERRLEMELIRKQIEEAEASLDRIQETGREQIENAQAKLNSVSEVRSSDVSVIQAELEEAIANLAKVKADLDTFYVRSPVSGQILSVNSKAGEIVGNRGIVAIGQTQQMYVSAEVYESDIQYVKVGQSAAIVSEYGGFEGELQGVVEQIGLQIDQPGITNDDPSARADVRVVKVSIRLDPQDSDRVKNLNKLQVRVSIQI